MNVHIAYVGVEIAHAVADRLKKGELLAYRHRDYCGMGLRYADDEFIYGEVNDGELPSSVEISHWISKPPSLRRLTFNSREEFVSWLAAQTDVTLGERDSNIAWLRGNQTLSIARLKDFAAGKPVPNIA